MISCSLEEQTEISQEVGELLAKGAKIEVCLTSQSYVSKIFLVEKKRGGLRPVINLKDLNNFVKMEHFKVEGLHLLPDIIQSVYWMVKLDLKDAYLQVPIHQSLLQFQWQGNLPVCMSPLRINISTQGVYKDNETSSGLLRQMGIRLVIYLDDLLIMHHSKAELLQFLSLICQLFKALDLMVNLEKSQMVPKQEMEFLGFQINSASFQLVFQSRKCRKSSRISATSFGLCEGPSKVCQLQRGLFGKPLCITKPCRE